MGTTITAKFEDGVFKPLEDVKIDEGTIVQIQVPTPPDQNRKLPSVGDFEFFGMWKDRAEMEDSVEYINNLRKNPLR